jgi:hypothetical protein
MILRSGGRAEPTEAGGAMSVWYHSLAHIFLFFLWGTN